jgi:hypothetical protein
MACLAQWLGGRSSCEVEFAGQGWRLSWLAVGRLQAALNAL